MISRIVVILFICAFAIASAATSTYQRFESFDTPPKNWNYFHANQLFGYTGGNAGGFFFPKPYTAYYADTNLHGAFQRGAPLKASGRIKLKFISNYPNYTNSVYIGHFRKGNTDKYHFANIVGIALTGNGSGAILCQPVVQFANGRAFVGGSIKFPVAPNTATMDFSYDWNPSAANGLGQLVIKIGKATSTLTLNNLSEGLNYTLNAFGIYQPAFVQPNSHTYLAFYVDRLSYTAAIGLSPRIRIKNPKGITTTNSRVVAFNGTARILSGSRIVAVRYRVIRSGRAGSSKPAVGTTRWSANVRIPYGTSKIEVTAIGDNGRIASARRTVIRVP